MGGRTHVGFGDQTEHALDLCRLVAQVEEIGHAARGE